MYSSIVGPHHMTIWFVCLKKRSHCSNKSRDLPRKLIIMKRKMTYYNYYVKSSLVLLPLCLFFFVLNWKNDVDVAVDDASGDLTFNNNRGVGNIFKIESAFIKKSTKKFVKSLFTKKIRKKVQFYETMNCLLQRLKSMFLLSFFFEQSRPKEQTE